MKNIKLILEYDGTNYFGWQKQPHGNTIQQAVEKAIFKFTKEEIEVIGCSRTDSKVHAMEYVCNFKTNSTIPDEKFMGALNHYLPEDIVVVKCSVVEDDFHARYNSKGKMYCYTIFNKEVPSAIYRNFTYHYKGSLNINNMIKASKVLIGTHDFSAFRNLGSSVKTNVRTIHDIRIESEKDFIKIYISADGFLYNMARIIVGTLLDVGKGKKKCEDMNNILESKNRKNAGKSVPPQGLSLIKVYY